MKRKEYNPCGDLTGREREICDAAVTSYDDLPFINVMRNIVTAEIADADGKNFVNENKIIDWAERDLNEIETQACVDFDSVQFETLTPLQVGLFKYFIHLLYENRYNIFYNRLAKFCDDEGITADESKIDNAAQIYDYNTSFNTLIENFQWSIAKAVDDNG